MFHLNFLIVSLAIFKFSASLPVEEEIVPVDLAYHCIGTGEKNTSKSPILLIHGILGGQNVWKSVELLLVARTHRRVCAVDLRNHGGSPWNNRTDVESLAADIGHFLDKKGIKKVNIIGHSLGGKTAMHYTLKNPDRVDSIIVEDIATNTIAQEAVVIFRGLFQLLKPALQSIPEGVTEEEEARKSMLNFLNTKLKEMGSSMQLTYETLEYFGIKLVNRKWQYNFNFDVLENTFNNLESLWTKSTGLYEGPSLFIYGTKSPFRVGEDKENILKLFPKAEIVPVEGAWHIIHGVHREFDDAVIRFLNKIN